MHLLVLFLFLGHFEWVLFMSLSSSDEQKRCLINRPAWRFPESHALSITLELFLVKAIVKATVGTITVVRDGWQCTLACLTRVTLNKIYLNIEGHRRNQPHHFFRGDYLWVSFPKNFFSVSYSLRTFALFVKEWLLFFALLCFIYIYMYM